MLHLESHIQQPFGNYLVAVEFVLCLIEDTLPVVCAATVQLSRFYSLESLLQRTCWMIVEVSPSLAEWK
jgi:hypothetical protein